MRFRKNLYPFQIAGALFLSERRFAILADDAGLGKMAQALAALGELDSAALVVTTTLGKNLWEAEIALGRNVLDRSGAGIFPSPGTVRVITTSELLRRKLRPNAAAAPRTVLIVDAAEIPKLESYSRLRTKLARLADAFMKADGGVWIMLPPERIDPWALALLETVGFALRRRTSHMTPSDQPALRRTRVAASSARGPEVKVKVKAKVKVKRSPRSAVRISSASRPQRQHASRSGAHEPRRSWK